MVSAVSNINALLAIGAASRADQAMGRAMERLASGKRINRASDDPAGLTAAEKLKGEERSIKERIDALDYNAAMFGAREGAQGVIADMLVELRGLVVQSGNRGAMSMEEREGLQTQASGILQTIDFLSQTTTFKGEQILTGTTTRSLGLFVRREPQRDPATPGAPNAEPDYAPLDLVRGDVEANMRAVEGAILGLSQSRAALGVQLKSMDSERRELGVRLENTTAARSAITDADYAKEASEFVRAQVLKEAGLFVAKLAMQQHRDTVLSLLKGPA